MSPPATLVGTERAATAASVGMDSSSVLFVVNALAVSFFSSRSGADPAVVTESSSSSSSSSGPTFPLLTGLFSAADSSLIGANAAATLPLFCDDRAGDGDSAGGRNGCVSRSNFSGESSAYLRKAGFG